MTSDLCDEDIGRITSQQIISTDALVSSLGSCVTPAPSVAASRVQASTAAVDLGRRLLLAARAGETATVFDLMAKGAPFTTDWLGTSPLHLAAANGHVQTCSVLLRAGVTRDSRTKVERTPLHLAAHAGHAEVVSLLLDHGAIVDCRDMLRMTPLHWAAARGHEAAARALLQRGADPRLRCKFRHTPRALAARKGHAALVQLLDRALLEPAPTPGGTAPPLATATTQPVFTEQIMEEARKAFGIDTLTKTPEIKIEKPKIKIQKDSLKQVKPEIKPEQQRAGGEAGEAGAAGEGGAAALLRRHGITLLPADDHSTVLSAIQSGRTVVLSDAGKLMLKESETPMEVSEGPVRVSAGDTDTSPSEGSAGTAGGSGPGGGGGVVIRATPVRAPPRGVKVFSVNNKLLLPAATAAAAKIPVKKIINPQDLQQMRFVQLSSEGARPARAQRPAPVKIFVNKANLTKLLAGDRADKGGGGSPASFNGTEISTESESPPAAVQLQLPSPREDASAEENKQLRAQLAAAHAALAAAAAELRAARDKLAAYETANHQGTL